MSSAEEREVIPIHRLYLDFVEFLNAMTTSGDPWQIYGEKYLIPNAEFLTTYWKKSGFSLTQIQERVTRLRREDYSTLLDFLHQGCLEDFVKSAIQRSREMLDAPFPDIYLFVGFFSSDGFVIELAGTPVIGIGLERFEELDRLHPTLPHEYCHYYLKLKGDIPATMQGSQIFSEGIASFFSQMVYPQQPLYRHLFFTRSRLNSCIQSEPHVFDVLRGRSLEEIQSLLRHGDECMQIPPRMGNYVSYRLVCDLMNELGKKQVHELLHDKRLVETWHLILATKLHARGT